MEKGGADARDPLSEYAEECRFGPTSLKRGEGPLAGFSRVVESESRW